MALTLAIKAEVSDPGASTFEFKEQKTMYGGKQVARGDTIYVFATENEGGSGLVAMGTVTSAGAHDGSRASHAKPHACGSPCETPAWPNANSKEANSGNTQTGTTGIPRQN